MLKPNERKYFQPELGAEYNHACPGCSEPTWKQIKRPKVSLRPDQPQPDDIELYPGKCYFKNSSLYSDPVGVWDFQGVWCWKCWSDFRCEENRKARMEEARLIHEEKLKGY